MNWAGTISVSGKWLSPVQSFKPLCFAADPFFVFLGRLHPITTPERSRKSRQAVRSLHGLLLMLCSAYVHTYVAVLVLGEVI